MDARVESRRNTQNVHTSACGVTRVRRHDAAMPRNLPRHLLIVFSVGKTVITWRASGEGTSLWIYQPAYINPQSIVQYGVYTINLGGKEMVSLWRSNCDGESPRTRVTVTFYNPILFITSTSMLIEKQCFQS